MLEQVAALQKIIKYAEETDWQNHSGKAPAEVQYCADIAKAALNSITRKV